MKEIICICCRIKSTGVMSDCSLEIFHWQRINLTHGQLCIALTFILSDVSNKVRIYYDYINKWVRVETCIFFKNVFWSICWFAARKRHWGSWQLHNYGLRSEVKVWKTLENMSHGQWRDKVFESRFITVCFTNVWNFGHAKKAIAGLNSQCEASFMWQKRGLN